ncbi:MAG: CRISPR system precrRNA processing endoribonuclease RAMP protein Cas6 [Candidatus Sericytochromatia bacterium]
MPHAFVIDFLSKKTLYQNDFFGKATHGLIFNIMKNMDIKLSTEIHEQIKKCITIRTLKFDKNTFSLRVTLLDDELFNNFSKVLIFGSVAEFNLNGNPIFITAVKGVNSKENPLSGYSSYQDFIDNVTTKNKFYFKIDTPIFFKKGENFSILPTPIDFFGSLLRSWNTFSTYKIDIDILNLIEKNVFVTSVDLQTKDFTIGKDISFIGTFGVIEFKTNNKDEDFLKKLNILSDFAFFSGVGAKTTMGMGQVFRK